MKLRRFSLQHSESVTPCPKCGNRTQFVAHSSRVQEDLCEIWAVCECGYDPHRSLDRFESVTGALEAENIRAAVGCWNDAVARRKTEPQPVPIVMELGREEQIYWVRVDRETGEAREALVEKEYSSDELEEAVLNMNMLGPVYRVLATNVVIGKKLFPNPEEIGADDPAHVILGAPHTRAERISEPTDDHFKYRARLFNKRTSEEIGPTGWKSTWGGAQDAADKLLEQRNAYGPEWELTVEEALMVEECGLAEATSSPDFEAMSELKEFQLDGHAFMAEQCQNGVLINPELPEQFDDTANEDRPASQKKWWDRPYIVSCGVPTHVYPDNPAEREKFIAEWMKSWPSGTRYDVRCLDGGAWDRSTNWGSFPNIEAALACAAGCPDWHKVRFNSEWPGMES